MRRRMSREDRVVDQPGIYLGRCMEQLKTEARRNADLWEGLRLLRSTATPLLDGDNVPDHYLVNAQLLDALLALATAEPRRSDPIT